MFLIFIFSMKLIIVIDYMIKEKLLKNAGSKSRTYLYNKTKSYL